MTVEEEGVDGRHSCFAHNKLSCGLLLLLLCFFYPLRRSEGNRRFSPRLTLTYPGTYPVWPSYAGRSLEIQYQLDVWILEEERNSNGNPHTKLNDRRSYIPTLHASIVKH